MRNYYFLSSYLPAIDIGSSLDVDFEDLKSMIFLNFSKEDKEKFIKFCRYIDIKNIKAFLLENNLDPRGNLDFKDLEDQLISKDQLEDFVSDFLNKNKETKDRIKNYPIVISKYLNFLRKDKDPFLSFFFSLEWEIKIVMTALRAFEAKKDISKELFFEDKKDFLIENILSQKGSNTLELPKEFEMLKQIFIKNKNKPEDLHLELIKYRFENVKKTYEKHQFTSFFVLGYLSNLILAEDYLNLDNKKGREIIESLV